MRQMKYRFLLLPLFFVLACVGAFAQANSEVTGIVTDQTGAVVPGADIVLVNPATGASKSTVSGSTGLYDLAGLNPANYNMKVTAKGFESFAQNGIVVNVSSTARVDIKLSVGAESQTVTVEADALAVQADSNVVSTLISSEQISQIATENRNFAALAAMGLGVSSALPDSNTPTSVAANFTISVNGLRQSHNIWLIDGGEADDRGGAGGMDIMPSQDAIAEFTVMSSNYPPDYGISSGATMSLSLKSGTQKFHGTLFEFNRNTDYDANNYFNKTTTTPTPRQVLNYNIYGFNLGGPLYIPKIYNKNHDKTFFFWNEEWRKINQGNSPNVVPTLATQDIPTAGQDLTYVAPLFATNGTNNGKGYVPGAVVPYSGAAAVAAGVQNVYFEPCLQASVTNPAACQAALLTQYGLTPGSPWPNNTIPHALFDPNAVLYLNSGILPKPNTSNGEAVSEAQTPITVRDDILRVDHKINDKWQILGHYMHDSVTQAYGGPELGWDWFSYNTVTSILSNPSNSAALKLSGTINPNLLVETSINYDGNIINITNSPNGNTPAGWGVNTFFDVTKIQEGKFVGQKAFPSMNGFGNPYGTAEQMGNAPWHNAAEDYEPKLDISYTVSKHAMKFGFSYNRYTKNQQVNGDTQGQFAWGGTSSGQFTGNLASCGTATTAACVQGDGLMDMLLGMSSSYDQQASAPIDHYVNQTPSAYALDNWHVSPRLTLQLGLRYDALPHAWERNNLLANFDPSTFLSSATPFWNAGGSMLPTGPGFQTFTIAGVTSPYYVNGMRLAGQGGFPRGLVKNDYDTIQPRVGFSEDLSGNGKTVLRGGFGTFFERIQGNDIYDAATNTPYVNDPSAPNVNMANPHVSTITGAVASTPTGPSGLTSLAINYRAPAVAMFSLGVQREISPSVVWVVQYVGNMAWHQYDQNHVDNFSLNTPMGVRSAGGNVTTVDGTTTGALLPTSGQGPVANNSNSFRVYPGYSGITQQETTTNGTYNGFQTGLRIQNRWGLSGELDYTYSHEIDIQTYDNTCCLSNPWYAKYDKGSGFLDRRNIFGGNYIYNLPIFTKSSGLLKSVAGGWELAGTFADTSGVPLANQYGGNDTIGLGGGYQNRMNATGKMDYPKKVKQWFDTAKLTVPVNAWDGGPNQGFGNSGKDAVVGPTGVNFTTSLYKSFAMTERAHFELRFESFNTFNHTRFNNVDVKNTDGNYGQVTNTLDPRTLELGGKFIF
ncbi:MAG: carboxypeptidase-like regulatory domain-containing protein [Terracidiphilus sp.]